MKIILAMLALLSTTINASDACDCDSGDSSSTCDNAAESPTDAEACQDQDACMARPERIMENSAKEPTSSSGPTRKTRAARNDKQELKKDCNRRIRKAALRLDQARNANFNKLERLACDYLDEVDRKADLLKDFKDH